MSNNNQSLYNADRAEKTTDPTIPASSYKTMINQKSAGAIVFYKNKDKREYLLVKGGQTGYWGFPKGWVEPGENETETALREIKEETGLEVKLLSGFREKVNFFFRNPTPNPQTNKKDLIFKEVTFFLGVTASKEIKLSWELQGYTWVTYEKALKQFKYKNYKNLLEKAEKFLRKTKN